MSATSTMCPVAYHNEGLDREVLDAFGIDAPEPDLTRWHEIPQRIAEPDGDVNVAVVGKYTGLKDAYKSLIQALVHGGIANRVRVNLEWIRVGDCREQDAAAYLEEVQRHPRARRLRRARHRRQDRGGALCPHRGRALFRHLLRHADGGDRGRAPCRRHQWRQLHRVRRDAGAGRRPDDGMDEWRGARAAASQWRSRRHDAARRL